MRNPIVFAALPGDAPTAPRRRRRIHAGEIAASATPLTIETLLGSCVAVCLHDPLARVGGMNHILLPGDVAKQNAPHFGWQAMEGLMGAVLALGGDRRRLVAKAFGAGNVLAVLRAPTVGDVNAAFVRQFLLDRDIPLVAQRMGGEQAVKVLFQTDTGNAVVTTVNGTPLLAVAAGQMPRPAAVEGTLDLAGKAGAPPADALMRSRSGYAPYPSHAARAEGEVRQR